MDPVTRAVAAVLESAAGRLLVGYSGGRDSAVLLHAVARLRRRDVLAVHVNHGLHPAADAWQAGCRDAAAQLGVTFLARRVTVSARGSLEAEARRARYQVFTELLGAGDHLLLAHHRQDQSETVLLRLLQGRGLYGMPQERRLGAGTLVRPLLEVDAADLEAYACEHRLTWVDDPSNDDLALDRNYLRHRVLPALRARWPDVDARLVTATAMQRLAARRLAASLAGATARALPLDLLAERTPAERVEMLRTWLEMQGCRTAPRRALAELLRQVDRARPDHQPRLQLGEIAVVAYDDTLQIVAAAPALRDWYRLSLPGALNLPHGRLTVSAASDGFRPTGAVLVRFRTGGEVLRHRGRTRSLKQLLQAARVPPWQRDSLPLLFDEQGLLAVPGIAGRDNPAGGGWQVHWQPVGVDPAAPP